MNDWPFVGSSSSRAGSSGKRLPTMLPVRRRVKRAGSGLDQDSDHEPDDGEQGDDPEGVRDPRWRRERLAAGGHPIPLPRSLARGNPRPIVETERLVEGVVAAGRTRPERP